MSAEAAEAGARAVVEADRRAVALDNELSALRAQAAERRRSMRSSAAFVPGRS
jgi:hypothetical protein